MANNVRSEVCGSCANPSFAYLESYDEQVNALNSYGNLPNFSWSQPNKLSLKLETQVGLSSVSNVHHEEAKFVTTLSYGKIIDNHVSVPRERKETKRPGRKSSEENIVEKLTSRESLELYVLRSLFL
ncbi:hypothetical protein Q3G72_017621 [Acer saccharum]|nr:hypothetical protein Q3G72_017621 [Acer saccharum]